MAAFSWMLCEGILMFIMIKLVFYNGFFKSKKFFSLVGWGKFQYVPNSFHCTQPDVILPCVGLPVPIVVVSAAVSHEQYGLNNR